MKIWLRRISLEEFALSLYMPDSDRALSSMPWAWWVPFRPYLIFTAKQVEAILGIDVEVFDEYEAGPGELLGEFDAETKELIDMWLPG